MAALLNRCKNHIAGAREAAVQTATSECDTRAYLKVEDYQFRPAALEGFPLYFFMAACETATKLDGNSMEWLPLEDRAGGPTRYQRSMKQERERSKSFPHRCLLTSAGDPIYSYRRRVHYYLWP